MEFAQEYLPPNFHDPATAPFVVLLVVVLLLLLIARPRVNVTDGLLAVVWLVLSLRMVRNGPLFAIVVTPILAEHWNAYLRSAAHIPHSSSLSGHLRATDFCRPNGREARRVAADWP